MDIGYFHQHPEQSWKLIKEIFYDFFGKAKPNKAHGVLADMEKQGLLQALITQNIDNLHQDAGSRVVHEFHGTAQYLLCVECLKKYHAAHVDFQSLPPRCEKCGGILKPDFVFFGEPIPEPAQSESFAEAERAEVFIVLGTTGEIMPASMIPILAKKNGVTIVEVNIRPSNYTQSVTDVFLNDRATSAMARLWDAIARLQ